MSDVTDHQQRPYAVVPPPPPPPRRWRHRLPELVALVGAALVAVAVAGFVTATWEDITPLQQAMVLGAGAAGLTVAGLWADQARARFEPVVGILWATATLLVVAAVDRGLSVTAVDAGRVVLAAAGLAGAVHAGLLLMRRRGSVVQQLALFGSLLYAAGPPGSALADRWDVAGMLRLIGEPLLGFVDPTVSTDAFLVTGLAHLVIGAGWIVLARLLDGRAAAAASCLAVVATAFAALQMNVLDSPLGSVGALAVVIGFLLYGVASEQPGFVAAGAVGALVAGVRVLVAVFSGAVLVTLLVFAGGMVLLVWAFRAMRQRQEADPRRSDDPGRR